MNNSQIIQETSQIENLILTIRGKQVILDRDLAQLYATKTKIINQAVKRNPARFPKEFCFQLSDKEKIELVTNCDRFKNLKHSTANPYAFTEQGISMLSTVINNSVAISVSIQIMNTFVEMRRFLLTNASLFQRIDNLESKQFIMDISIQKVLNLIELEDINPKQGIFFEGQIFDAYILIQKIVNIAKTSIILVDNYVNEDTLQLFSKRNKNISCNIYTSKITQSLLFILEKYNTQYQKISLHKFKNSHDRFLIIDKTIIYHFGASLKDLGKKWFAFSKLDIDNTKILDRLTKIVKN